MAIYGDTLTKNIKGAFKTSLEVGDYKLSDDQEKVIDKLSQVSLSPTRGMSLNGVALVTTPAEMLGTFALRVKNSTFGN